MDDRHAQPETVVGRDGPPPSEQGRDEFAPPWHEAAHTQIEAWLLSVPDTERGPRLESMIAEEVERRRGDGEDPAVAEYLRRFPGQTELVARAFGLRPRRADVPLEEISTEDRTVSIGVATDDPGTELEAGVLVGRRYVVRRVLGKGGCAIVYLAHDPMLDRLVALKMPRSEGFRTEEELAAFIREARNAAQLDFPGIVRTYDVQSDPGVVFIVQQFIDGPNLSTLMKSGRMSQARAVDLMIGVSQALEHAHGLGFVHRDIKPANILLDAIGRPYLSDFGLALHESTQRDHWGELAGTCPYMSPEQVRREVHRLDGRSDLWGLGIIFYELLTGCRPFTSTKSADLFEEIERHDPGPPHEVDPAVPAELSRICMKCLAKRASERYASAAELTDDLRHWRDADPSRARRQAAGPDAARVVPKGLRSFEAGDADFFLELLPGPRDRAGLPEGLRFWKHQLERIAPDERLAVCLMYGPSGSGKSSLVKAGLIPRLAGHVLPIYVEATASETESRLLRALRLHDPEIPADATLPDAVERLRAAGGIGGKKVLVVLDQFEQWLHATGGLGDGLLPRALRQCDGGGVQCLLLVRDDFWMSITRFMKCLEIPQVEGLNSAAVDLFDPGHARKVLRAFGRAFDALPEGEPPTEQERFLDLSVRGLARDGKIITVRLAVFAEMMKGRPWTPEGLEAVGGPEGVDQSFLEETFSAPGAPPAHRLHEHAARGVLKALLPEHGSDIRGRMQPVERLLEASGYAERPDDFQALLRILDGELRLITPTEPDGLAAGPGPESGARYYQLTHDFLIPSLRSWLTTKQRETPRGRAELRLEERTALWTDRREPKQLPSWWEWVGIKTLTREAEWTEPQKRMMRAASRHHLIRSGLLATAVAAVAVAALGTRYVVMEQWHRSDARLQVQGLWDVGWRSLPAHLDRMGERPDLWKDEVGRVAAREDAPAEHRTRAYLALARHDDVGLDHLTGRLLVADSEEHPVIRGELRRRRTDVAPVLWRHATDPTLPPRARLAAAVALADYDPGDARWDAIAGPVVRPLLETDPLLVNPWVEVLRPVRKSLRPHLIEGFVDPSLGENPRSLAASILANFASSDAGYLDAQALAELILEATPAQTAIIQPHVLRRRDELVGRLADVVGTGVPLEPDDKNEHLVRRRANAAVALRMLGRDEAFWPLLRQSEDPRLRTRLIDRVAPGSPGWEALLDRVETEREGPVRQAILIGLEPMKSALSESDRLRAADRLMALYEDDPDGGVHGAAEWVLTRWGFGERVAAAKGRLAGKPRGKRGWYITSELHTMIVIPRPGKFLFGLAKHERGPGDENWEWETSERSIDYTFAISAHEVTREQFEHYSADVAALESSPERDCPVNFVSWYEAARYCRWLSDQEAEGIPESERNYPHLDEDYKDIRYKLPKGHLWRKGYRLPTVEEWEYVARAGSATVRFFGNATADLDNYAWWSHNSGERIWPVGRLRPNPLGLFDIYGNVHEWCELLPPNGNSEDEHAGLRGGSYKSTARFLRSAMPEWMDIAQHYSNHGFRIVRVEPGP
jgi:formylglycine-generating enzyme required for sulfatase activity/tRNA A-37 threonylcarbamoyl transferase component Bud32